MVDDWDNDDAAPPEEGKGLLPKSLHKALVTGMSAVLMTEEGIRKSLGDMRLPKEAISYVIQQTEKSRKDLYQAITGEIKGFLENVDVSSAVRKALVGMRVEVRADIRFVDEGKAETKVETHVVTPGEAAKTTEDAGNASHHGDESGERKKPRRRRDSL